VLLFILHHKGSTAFYSVESMNAKKVPFQLSRYFTENLAFHHPYLLIGFWPQMQTCSYVVYSSGTEHAVYNSLLV
jgi:hypothetical protein